MSAIEARERPLEELAIPLERDVFMRTLIRELAGTLQEVVGLEEASGFISVVGQRMGDQINSYYKQDLAVSNLSCEQVAQVLVDLKARIQGDFFILSEDDEKIVLGNRACPFAEKVVGRPVKFAFDEMRLVGKQATALALVTNELVSNAVKHGRGQIEITCWDERVLLKWSQCAWGLGEVCTT